jgi:hypothetical protein
MRTVLTALLVAAGVSLAAAPAFANKAAADACAAKLPANAKLIYAASIGGVTPDANLEDLIRGKTRSLVMGGKISRGDARGAAEAAAGCLKQAR